MIKIRKFNKKDLFAVADLISKTYAKFNSGEPIVETPEDAVKNFMAMSLDYLICGDVLIEKS